MEQKINGRLIFIALLSMALTLTMSFLVFRRASDTQARESLEREALLVAAAWPELYDDVRRAEFVPDTLRVTLISPTGEVLFESDHDPGRMENHLTRPEVVRALENGEGADTRRSATIGISTYYYALRLPGGEILRLGRDMENIYAISSGAVPYLVIIALALLAVSVVLAAYLTRGLLRPIEEMGRNVDAIDENVPYKELEPFARAIKEQQLHRQEAEKIRQEFTANVSHELKTPLTSISGYAEMIETGIADQKDIRDFAGKIRFEAGRLIRLIGDIIQLAELDETNRALRHEPVDLAWVAQSTLEYLSLSAQKARVTLEARGPGVLIQGDKQMVEEMIYNLCDNAIRYNKPGGKVTLETGTDGERAVISVIDTGIGIPEEHQARIFERFYRVDKSRSRDSGGTGLGLAIVKHAAMQHGADLILTSKLGQGTVITIKFP